MIRVALIEDDPTMRGLLCEAIQACEDMILTDEADNAAAASGMIEAGGYDVLLCDLGLPDGSGIDLIRQEAKTGHYMTWRQRKCWMWGGGFMNAMLAALMAGPKAPGDLTSFDALIPD